VLARLGILVLGIVGGGQLGCSDAGAPGDGDGSQPAAVSEQRLLGAADDYVLVPGARVHKSCVIELPDGAGAAAESAIVYADGHRKSVAHCAFQSISTRAGAAHTSGMAAGAGEVPAISGWIEEAYWQTESTVGAVAANWTVPDAPSHNGGQTIFIFPSLQHTYSNSLMIIQPVLQWGSSGAGGGAWWGAASWVGPINGNFYHGPLLAAAPHESIRGVMSGSSCSSGSCATWSTNTYNKSRGTRSNVMYHNNPYGFWYISGGVLEAYNVNYCSDMPASYTALTNVHVRNTAGTLLSPPWSNTTYRTMCSDYVWSDTHDVHLHY